MFGISTISAYSRIFFLHLLQKGIILIARTTSSFSRNLDNFRVSLYQLTFSNCTLNSPCFSSCVNSLISHYVAFCLVFNFNVSVLSYIRSIKKTCNRRQHIYDYQNGNQYNHIYRSPEHSLFFLHHSHLYRMILHETACYNNALSAANT